MGVRPGLLLLHRGPLPYRRAPRPRNSRPRARQRNHDKKAARDPASSEKTARFEGLRALSERSSKRKALVRTTMASVLTSRHTRAKPDSQTEGPKEIRISFYSQNGIFRVTAVMASLKNLVEEGGRALHSPPSRPRHRPAAAPRHGRRGREVQDDDAER